MRSSALIPVLFAALVASACTPVEKRADLAGSASVGTTRTAGPGDTVMEFRLSKPLPNAFGQADIFGRTTDAGKVTVRFLGVQGGRAVFERSDISVETNATTMNQTPMMVPQTSQTQMSGMVGMTPVSGTATSTSYSYVGPRPTTGYVSAARPLAMTLAPGESVTAEGRTLTLIRINGSSIEYRID